MGHHFLILLFILSTCLYGGDTLIVGTNAEFPPFTYVENKTIVGFDIDVAKAVANKLGKKIQFKDMPFDALIPEVVLGRVDFVAAGMSATEERAKRVAFTQSYLPADPLVILSKQKLSLSDLQGKKIVVIEGFTADSFMSSQKGITLIRLPTQADGFLALKTGRADAFITAQNTVSSFMEKQDSAQYQMTIIEGTGETCAMMVPKQNKQMLADIQKALDELESEGTMTQLKMKWKLQ